MAKQTKVLVIRFSSIGDIVLTSPVLRCLKKAPGLEVELHFATKKAFAGLLVANPYIDKLHLLDGKLSDFNRKLRVENFDHIIDLHHNTRTAIIKWALRKPSSSFKKLNVEKWLMVNLKINRLPQLHIVDRYFEVVRAFGVVNDGEGLDFFLPENTESFHHLLPATIGERYIAFAIGGKHATKRLPNEKIISVINKLPLPVVLLGGNDDTGNALEIASQCAGKVFNGCGKFTIQQSAYIVRNAEAVITHDTGLMHIAAAFKKPIVSVWGNTVTHFGMYPYMPQHPERSHIVEVRQLPCRPCSKIGHSKCPKGHFDCMMKIDVDEIVRATKEMKSKI
jgi:ADP-heptose:LPS heptosyltransferase